MKIKNSVQLLLLVLWMAGCKKDSPVKEREFVAGDVIIGIKSGFPIHEVFDLMNENGITIDHMSGFFYYSTLPTDSLDYIVSELRNKEYFNKRGFKGGSAYNHAIEHRIVVAETFFEMNLPAQNDWLLSMEKLELKDLDNDTRYLLIKVEPGTEELWLDRFRNHPYVKWVELNRYADIVLH